MAGVSTMARSRFLVTLGLLGALLAAARPAAADPVPTQSLASDVTIQVPPVSM